MNAGPIELSRLWLIGARGMRGLRGFLLGGLIFGAAMARGQEGAKNTLSFEVGFVGTAQTSKTQNKGFESETRLVLSDRFNGKVDVRAERSGGEVTWYPRSDSVKLEGNLYQRRTTRSNLLGEGGVTAVETRVDAYTGDVIFEAVLANAFLKQRPGQKRYDIQFAVMADMATTQEAVRHLKTREIVGAPSLGGGKNERSTENVPLGMGPAEMNLNVSYDYLPVVVTGETYSGETGDLGGSKTIPVPKPAGWQGPWTIAIEVVWQLEVQPLPLELILTATDYDEWRPTTTPDRVAGTALEVNAELVSRNGSKPNVRVERFIWELDGTSTETGVALNFPRDPEFEYDLQLDASGAGFELSQLNQKMVRKAPGTLSDKARVVPFDWGGWSTLRVTAVLADGRRVKGKLKGQSEAGLRVPKRSKDSHIADGWKARNQGGPDTLDDEDEPLGDSNKGDGFALYEEYRGFVIEGAHVEGDSKAKDFFVLNLMKADGEPGIRLFESLSGFRVHATTLDTEISPVQRLMNGNRGEGAHAVDQHAVVLVPFDKVEDLRGTGGFTFPYSETHNPKQSFRPVTVKSVGLLKRGHAESDFSKPFNLTAEDALSAYDRAIAHELMHAVGAIHHGAGDGQIEFVFVPPTSSANSSGRPYFALNNAKNQPVELRNEAGHDLAAGVYPRYMAAYNSWATTFRTPLVGNPGDAGYPQMTERAFEDFCEGNVVSGFSLTGLVGAEGGEHAGDQDCIMRYYFANFYPMKKPAAGFYQIAAGAERIGCTLCRARAGTGVNGPDHAPQSRHGPALSGAGNCAGQISPNDAAPARTTPF